MENWMKASGRAFGSPGRITAAKDLFADEVPIYLNGPRIKSMLLLLALVLLTIRPAAAQFTTPTVDGVISAGEYGSQNQQSNGTTTWYMTWNASNLYIGIADANVSEGAVIYVDGNPIAPINGGTNADGTLVGQNYDGTNFAALQFRADYVSYFKDGYREHRTANGSNGWSGETTLSGNYSSNGSTVREYAIPWGNITGGSIPSSFNWFGYVTSSGGSVFGEMPTENGSGFIGTSAREARYFTVSNTANGASTKPFSRNSFVFNSASDISGFGGINVFDFTMNSSGRQIFRSADASTWIIGGDLRVDAGTIHFDNTTGAATVSGNVIINSGGTLNLGNVSGGNLNLVGNWINNGTFNHNSRMVTFNGTGTQTISGSSTTNFGILAVNMGTSTSVLDVQSLITITTGNLNLFQGMFRLSSASTITPFSGSETIPAAAGFHLNHASAVSSWGSSGTLTLLGTVLIDNGTMTIGSSTGNELELTASTSNATINGGNLNLASRVRVVSSGAGNGLTINGGEVVVTTVANGSGSVAGFNMNSTGKFTMTGGTVTVQRANTGAAGDIVLVSGTGAKSITGGIFRFGNASTPASQIMKINSAIPIFHFTVNSANATAQLLTNSLDINGDLTISAGVLDANNLNIDLAGDWTNNGTFTPGTGTVTLNGTSPQTMSGSTFNNLTINNSSGVTLLTDETVSNTLTLSNGNVSTGANKMVIAAGGNVSRTSGHIVGNLQKNFATGSNVVRSYEVGTGIDYTPVNVTIASVSTAGNVTAKSSAGDHSNISSSTLDASKSVNRNWTVTADAGLNFTTYEATFNFVAGDLDGGANTSNLIVGKFNSPNWSYPTVGTRTATSTQATGMTSFSDFQLAESLPAQMTYTVINTNDAGSGSLRQAISDANAHPNLDASTPDLIHFNITSGTGPFTIAPASALPTITDPVIIDGLTQPGASCTSWPPTLLIELNGTSAGSGVNGLNITAGNTTVRGLVINRFTSDGIEMSGSGSNVIECNLIGTNVAGTTNLGNSADGVFISNVANNTIGGTATGARNVISGNNQVGILIQGIPATGNLVQGNFIGTDMNGTAALPNSSNGVFIQNGATNNTIGGTAAGSRNVISGNGASGVEVELSNGNFIQGNYIGTDVNGTADLGNTGTGILIDRSASTTIGGASAAARNVISGNNVYAIELVSSQASGTIVQGNYIGTNAAGAGALANSIAGIVLNSAPNTTIGGTSASEGNLISGNTGDGIVITSSGNLVQGNLIGTNASGTAALGNSGRGVAIFGFLSNNTIGGVTSTPGAAPGNVISGNGNDGINISDATTSGIIVQGNLIGTDINGTTDLGNAGRGLVINNSPTNTIGGAASGSRNIISGNNHNGVEIRGSTAMSNLVQGNFIGTDINGTAGLGNSAAGMLIDNAPSNTIGGTVAQARNIIAGNNNSYGIAIANASATNNLVQGNYIGTNVNGTAALPNFRGVSVQNGSANNSIGGTTAGAGNLISGNATGGVEILFGSTTINNAIQGNAIFSNGSLGIDLGSNGLTPNDAGDGDTGSNNFQNFPVLSSASVTATQITINGSLNSTANTNFTLEFFSNTACDPSGFGEGETFLGSATVMTDGSGNVNFSETFNVAVASGSFITATATDPGGNTSEFSVCQQAVAQPCPTANAGADLATTPSAMAKIGANPTGSGGTGTLTYSWSPSTGLSSTTVANPTATPASTTTYTVIVTDANNCAATDQVTVRAGNLVNSRIQFVIGPTNFYNPTLNQVEVDIAIKNISNDPIHGPLTAVITTLTSANPVSIPNANGGGQYAGCYYDYSTLLGMDNILTSGETSAKKLWIIKQNALPPKKYTLISNIVGDLDGLPKTAADEQSLSLRFDPQNGMMMQETFPAGTGLGIPVTHALHQNHPNPFNPSTTMQFDLPKAGEVTLKIYNNVGQLVRTLVSGKYEAGSHKVIWDAHNDSGVSVTSGVYLAVFKAGEVKQVRRVVLMK